MRGVGCARRDRRYSPGKAWRALSPKSQAARKATRNAQEQPEAFARANLGVMSETEDYPGPSQKQPEKEGQEQGRANEHMVKPTERPKPHPKTDKVVEPRRETPSRGDP